MRQVVEVMVAGKEMQAVFDHECGNPDIVGGNRRTLLTQLAKELSVVSRCGLASVENGCPGPIEKTPQNVFVFAGVCAALETGVQFGQGDEGQYDLLGELDAI